MACSNMLPAILEGFREPLQKPPGRVRNKTEQPAASRRWTRWHSSCPGTPEYIGEKHAKYEFHSGETLIFSAVSTKPLVRTQRELLNYSRPRHHVLEGYKCTAVRAHKNESLSEKRAALLDSPTDPARHESLETP